MLLQKVVLSDGKARGWDEGKMKGKLIQKKQWKVKVHELTSPGDDHISHSETSLVRALMHRFPSFNNRRTKKSFSHIFMIVEKGFPSCLEA